MRKRIHLFDVLGFFEAVLTLRKTTRSLKVLKDLLVDLLDAFFAFALTGRDLFCDLLLEGTAGSTTEGFPYFLSDRLFDLAG